MIVIRYAVAYLGGAMRPWPPPPSESPKTFFDKIHVKNWISNLYILLKSALKMQEMPFQRPKFQKKIFGGACPRTPLKLCRHYGLPLTKIVATPLTICYTIYWGNESFLCCQTCTALRHWKQWSFAEMMLQS